MSGSQGSPCARGQPGTGCQGQKKKMLCLWLHGPKKKGRSVGFFFFFFFFFFLIARYSNK